MLCLIDLLLPETIKYNTSGTCGVAMDMLYRTVMYSGVIVIL
jgi:hypothetical protein